MNRILIFTACEKILLYTGLILNQVLIGDYNGTSLPAPPWFISPPCNSFSGRCWEILK